MSFKHLSHGIYCPSFPLWVEILLVCLVILDCILCILDTVLQDSESCLNTTEDVNSFHRQSTSLNSGHKFQPAFRGLPMLILFSKHFVLLGAVSHVCHSVTGIWTTIYLLVQFSISLICWLEEKAHAQVGDVPQSSKTTSWVVFLVHPHAMVLPWFSVGSTFSPLWRSLSLCLTSAECFCEDCPCI